MSAIEEHKPVEKRRALGRGLDALLPSGQRALTQPVNPPFEHREGWGTRPSPVVMPPPPVVISTDPGRESELTVSSVPASPQNGEARNHEMQTSGISGTPQWGTPHPLSEQIAELHAGAELHPPKHSLDGAPRPEVGTPHADAVQEIPLELIDGNPYQTRRTFDEAPLRELADSIRESGLAQPVVVRPGADGRYALVLGERRCRASKLAGKKTVPAIVRELGNEQAAELTVIENLQRQDLNCLEQAQAFARLSREFNLTQEQIGKRVGTSRESVANYMRLLKLPQPVQELIGEGKLGFSEARVLLEAMPHVDPGWIVTMALSAAEQGLTVRELKRQVERVINPELDKQDPPQEKHVDPNVRDAERRLLETLGMRVRIVTYAGNRGQVVIRYESLADFDRIFDRLSRDK